MESTILSNLTLVVTTQLAANGVKKVLSSFEPINTSDASVKQCAWFAVREYNKRSDDKNVFLVASILQAKLQITSHLEYLIHVQLVRSNCPKSLSNNENCVLLKPFNLEKKMNCRFLVGAFPWKGEFTLLEKQCEDV
uniref:cystatin-8 n=1 Tax=Jaculus jaculus TaxID=51337 RepID=UPI001E1B0D45|nr:cystatin-8 [Jaculus jaculus]